MTPDDSLPRSFLITGGARSGKSAYAQRLAEASSLVPVYIATGQAGDAEMAARIALHRAARGPNWRLVEAPLELVAALQREAGAGRVLLVDCLTLWLSNLMHAGRDPEREGAALAAALPGLPGRLIFITNEVGAGIVPDNRLARDFRDAQGRLNQTMAQACEAATLVVMGLALRLKG